MRIKKYIIIILLVVIAIPLVVIFINVYRDRDIVLKVAVYPQYPYGDTYYYILRSNRVLESYQGIEYNPGNINRHYYLKKTYKKASDVVSEEDYNHFLKSANEIVERTFLECLGQGDWMAIIYYNGKTYETPGFDDVGIVKELLYKVTGLSPIPFEYREKYFAPKNGSFSDLAK